MKDIVLLSTADWDYPFWTNKQHTAQALVKLGYRVFYIDSLGTRKLRLAKTGDLKRIWQRLRRLFVKPREVEPNLWVWSPCVLPAPKSQLLRWVNRQLFQWQLSFWLSRLSFHSKPVLWTYNPLTLMYTATHHYSSVVYHCVDNIAEQPGAFVDLIEKYEAQLFKSANHVFVTSRSLETRAKQYRADVHYHSNVVDYDHFHQATQNIAVPDDLAAIPSPRAGFIGAISGYKVDLQLLREVAGSMPHVSFVFIGTVGEGDPDTNIDELKKLPNVHFLGARKYVELPAYLKGLDVCLIPSVLNEYTKCMFPMKFFEYLAAGKAIIATDIDALRELGDVYYVARNAPEFCQHMETVLSSGEARMRERGFALAQENTYLVRTDKMLKCLRP